MRTRSAKKLAQRIDLNYFKHAYPLRRWRTMLSVAAPAIGLIWVGGMAAAGSRAAYSSGPVSTAHAFAEAKCEVCHVRDTSLRAHVGDAACLACHDAPAHAASRIAPPGCATCHREHQGRVALARTPEAFCVRCHGDPSAAGPRRAPSGPKDAAPRAELANPVTAFPSGHPEFAVRRPGARDPGTIKFNHAVHLKPELRGPSGPETLQCIGCHEPDLKSSSPQRRTASASMAAPTYKEQCARCHPLFFDERIDRQAPHEQARLVHAFVERALREYIAAHPDQISRPDPPPRRLALNLPRPPAPPARNADEWVAGRLARAEDLLWRRTCGGCHAFTGQVLGKAGEYSGPVVDVTAVASWMPHARFDHRPHLMVTCTSCHAAEASTTAADVLMPAVATCATCHAPGRGAESGCFECHGYHDWTKEHAVAPRLHAADVQPKP